jgi:ABC-2 type transport system ATP-binding protein
MSEMELMCDRVGIIANGKMLGVHTLSQIVNSSNGSAAKISMRVDDVQNAFRTGLFKDLSATSEGNIIHMNFMQEDCDSAIAALIKKLTENGVSIYSVSEREHSSLEDAFIQITQNGEGGGQIG